MGVWTEYNGTKVREVDKKSLYSPSYWLLWELGVAQALKMKWCLLISTSIDPKIWQQIAPGITHYIYEPGDTGNFDEKLEEGIQGLLTGIS